MQCSEKKAKRIVRSYKTVSAKDQVEDVVTFAWAGEALAQALIPSQGCTSYLPETL